MTNRTFGQEFETTFVPATGGVQTSERVNGRRAFPDRRGPQPEVGETWLVAIAGENRPKNTVYFLTCKERISAAVQQATGKKGVDSYRRARAFLNPPPKTVSALSELGAVLAQRRAQSDALACQLLSSLSRLCFEIDTNTARAAALTQELDSFVSYEIDDAKELLTTRSEVASLKELWAGLKKDTLFYARLCKQVKAALVAAAGSGPGAEAARLQEHAADVKEELDDRRAHLRHALTSTEKLLDQMERDRAWRHDIESFDRLLAIFAERQGLATARPKLNDELASVLASYEARLDTLKFA